MNVKMFTNDNDVAPVMATTWMVAQACDRIAGSPQDQQMDMIEGLWNWIDHMPFNDGEEGDEPDAQRKCWKILAERFPFAFLADGNTNNCLALGHRRRNREIQMCRAMLQECLSALQSGEPQHVGGNAWYENRAAWQQLCERVEYFLGDEPTPITRAEEALRKIQSVARDVCNNMRTDAFQGIPMSRVLEIADEGLRGEFTVKVPTQHSNGDGAANALIKIRERAQSYLARARQGHNIDSSDLLAPLGELVALTSQGLGLSTN